MLQKSVGYHKLNIWNILGPETGHLFKISGILCTSNETNN